MTDPIVRPKKSLNAERHDAMVEKIRRLMALSTSSNPHEAGMAASKAAELMHKYAIEQFEVDQAASRSESLIRDGWYNADRDAIHWQFGLLGTIAHVNFCKALVYEQSSPPRYRLFGQPHAIEITMYIFDYLCAEFDIYMDADLAVWKLKQKRGGVPVKAAEVLRWKSSFLDSCAGTVKERLRIDFETRNVEEVKSTAMMIFNDKAIFDYMAENGAATRGYYQPPAKVVNGDGYLAGIRRGNQIDLNRHGIRDGDHSAPAIERPALRITEHKSL